MSISVANQIIEYNEFEKPLQRDRMGGYILSDQIADFFVGAVVFVVLPLDLFGSFGDLTEVFLKCPFAAGEDIESANEISEFPPGERNQRIVSNFNFE